MSKKIILYILLVLGLVIIGAGAWLLYAAMNDNATESDVVTIDMPQGDPVIYERVLYTMEGIDNELYIYADGGILYIEEKGLRFPSPEHPATRTWGTGNLTAKQMNDLLTYFESSGLAGLEDSYSFLGKSEGGSNISSDMSFTIIVNSDNLSKKVTTFGYLSPDNGGTYPDMPSPLDDIYERLRTIVMTTEEVTTVNIE